MSFFPSQWKLLNSSDFYILYEIKVTCIKHSFVPHKVLQGKQKPLSLELHQIIREQLKLGVDR